MKRRGSLRSWNEPWEVRNKLLLFFYVLRLRTHFTENQDVFKDLLLGTICGVHKLVPETWSRWESYRYGSLEVSVGLVGYESPIYKNGFNFTASFPLL